MCKILNYLLISVLYLLLILVCHFGLVGIFWFLFLGDTKVLVAVYGPKAGTKKNENPEKACIEVIWKPKSGQIGEFCICFNFPMVYVYLVQYNMPTIAMGFVRASWDIFVDNISFCDRG